jgi:IS5 family transposase
LRRGFQQSGAGWRYDWEASRTVGEARIEEKFFKQIVETQTTKGLILQKETIVDSTIVSSPSSTKNREKKRDPEAHQVKKGNAWHFGYKAHTGADIVKPL